MGKLRQISYLWQDDEAAESYITGVSLHSHTNQSKETLDFLATLGKRIGLIDSMCARVERRAETNHSISVNYAASYWTPPLTPKLAFDLEGAQIEKLGLRPLVSLSDHDNIQAPMLLRTVASARHIPVSVEWSVPYGGDQSFHLGIHNLPSDTGQGWMQCFAEFTANPAPDAASDARLTEILAALHALPNVLIVFNHPMWDLYLVGAARHAELLRRFMAENGEYIHALELNGLRTWSENRSVRTMARDYNKLLISGGDRHGMEPNANINLTNAGSFTEFVHEIRYQGRSHVLFMPQYAEPFKHRVLRSTLDVIRDYPEFPLGSRRWDERVFHPDQEGNPQPVAQLWPDGNAPNYITFALQAVRLLGSRPLSRGLRRAWSERSELQLALGE
ncbi:hypothetical protein [Acidipila sp. EB88]|uniref:hypothetical protein n=1 Tax=Acidipila sp. EB88 TaxID=2305226 RepID=UPI000F5D4EB3|nr:hypothetical protein [Acidipila sp. EB88]RRA47950.1 hypothetical protein D1Y84_06260 [Acidipila sp. EB88]